MSLKRDVCKEITENSSAVVVRFYSLFRNNGNYKKVYFRHTIFKSMVLYKSFVKICSKRLQDMAVDFRQRIFFAISKIWYVKTIHSFVATIMYSIMINDFFYW